MPFLLRSKMAHTRSAYTPEITCPQVMRFVLRVWIADSKNTASLFAWSWVCNRYLTKTSWPLRSKIPKHALAIVSFHLSDFNKAAAVIIPRILVRSHHRNRHS